MAALGNDFMDGPFISREIKKKVWRAKADLEFAREACEQEREIAAQESEDFEHRIKWEDAA